MDNPSNLDGFDGLPLDLWISQFQPHQENPSTVFHHANSQSLREYPLLTSRAIPGALPMEDTLAQGSQSSHLLNPSVLSQYGLALTSQPDHQPINHERSAWSHMMSLDQTLGSYGTYEPARLLQNRYSSLDDLVEKAREDNLIKNHPASSFTSMNFSRSQFTPSVSESSSTYFQHPAQNSSHEKVSQHLGHLMNLSKTSPSMEKASHPLSISTDMSSLESSGEYSPVSPPTTTVVDKLVMSRSSTNSGHVVDLLQTDHEVMGPGFAPSLSSDSADIFNSFSKMDSCPSSLSSHVMQNNKIHGHLLDSLVTYNELPSDSPLDMTTAISSKSDKSQPALPKLLSTSSTFESSVKALNSSVTSSDKLPLLQTLLNKGKIVSDESVNVETMPEDCIKQQPLELSITSQVKMVKPLKSTPKKSNFYGRDASLFSFPSQETINGSSQSYVPDEPSKTADHKNNSAKEDSDGLMGKSISDKSENSFTDAWDQAPLDDSSNLNLNNSGAHHSDNNIFPLTSSDSVFPSGFSSSLAQSIDSFIEESTRKTVDSDKMTVDCDDGINLLTIEETKTMENELTNSVFNTSSENDTEMQSPDYTDEDFSLALVKAKPSKGKKRKGAGFQPKARKQPARKRGRAKNLKAANTSENELLVNTGVSELNEGIEPLVNQQPRKKRGPPKPRVVAQDVTPRRSSSRKSKDNAMRLIELQADANYTGFRQPDDEQTTEKKSLRSSKKTAVVTELNEELSEEESIDDKSDDDYVIDEEANKDEILEAESDRIMKSKERKTGGLKISIKLSGNSSAEIVSGIADSPARKKRKLARKKISKDKLDTLINEMPEDASEENHEITDKQQDEKEAGSLDSTDKHKSLIEKYFSSANSATVARLNQKSSLPMKGKKIKKKAVTVSSKLKNVKDSSVKALKNIDEEPERKQKSTVKFNLSKETKTEKVLDKEDLDVNTPKFVCGYCPQRYHSKQDLMAHMEDHLMEMETKDTTDDKKRDNENIGAVGVSRDPRANRTPTNASSQSSNKQGVPDKKVKLVVELSKDIDPKNELARTKFTCGECGESFPSKPLLLDHVRIHTADKPFECDICHKCFTERNLLSAHRKTHVPEKLLRCHMCSKAFVDKADLNYHMQSHPKRSVTNLPGKLDPVHKKPYKITQEIQEKGLPLVPKKPTSFASALSGETETSERDNSAPLVLLLKRGGETSTSISIPKSSGSSTKAGDTTATSIPKITSNVIKSGDTPTLTSVPKSISSNSTVAKNLSAESKIIPKTSLTSVQKVKSDVSEPRAKLPDISANVKEDDKQTVNKSEVIKTSLSKPTVTKTEQADNGVCKCKECPECVTRFLQSFE
ncbi:hypothetical protein Btru_055218 [Bulinus truncatus]|nr:hypothetical protein Btru_055218 [Bulinus truncatus]